MSESLPADQLKPVAVKRNDQHRRSIVKTISWRTIGSLDTMLISFLVFTFYAPTNPLEIGKAAGLVGMLEVPNKLLLYYLHERVWSRIKWGTEPQVLDYEI